MTRIFRAVFGRATTAWALAAVIATVVSIACGACGSNNATPPYEEADTGTGTDGADETSTFGPGGDHVTTSLSVDPLTVTLTIANGVITTQAFTATAHFSDNTSADVTNGTAWTATNLPIGNIAGGVYTPSGDKGGAVKIGATYQGQKGSATLNVKLQIIENPGALDPAAIGALKGASAPDGTVVWAYPYNGTVFPRGIDGPKLMWNNGGAADAYYIHVTSPTFELESFAKVAPPARYVFSPGMWTKFVDSTAGAATLHVARIAGGTGVGAATVLVDHTWTISPASMRGTIYYWANNLGRVMRIKPGAAAPDDFSATSIAASVAAITPPLAAPLPTSGCTMTCHTVSADGSTIVSGGDTLGGTYDLIGNKAIYDTGGAPGSAQKRVWAMPALAPNGKYLVENSSPLPGPPGGADGLWNTANGTRVASSGLDGVHLGMPNFAPDGTKLAYVNTSSGALAAYNFSLAAPSASGSVDLVAKGAGDAIAWPSMTPDAKGIIYERGSLDTRYGPGDLFFASAVTPNQEVRLAALDGDTYPFAAGTRDKSYNYEPTFAPVPSGGFFWVVFTSRRTYGNELTGVKDAVKQLWVAAIDLNPAAATDPSHPPFLLPGQDITSLNMRGFWALDPCKGDGQGCGTGTECCGGFCDGTSADGGFICASAGTCAQDGDHCNTAADCCNGGSSCINHVCSEPAPK